MAQRTVWLRRDPVGSRTRLPPRAEFRRYQARRGFVLGAASLVALAVLVVLELLDRAPGMWRPLAALAFFLGIGGIAAAAVPLRTRELRRRALAAIGLSTTAAILALVVPTLLD
jgi:peptidoglycan/LPS O-acetylase OafA/YrhL